MTPSPAGHIFLPLTVSNIGVRKDELEMDKNEVRRLLSTPEEDLTPAQLAAIDDFSEKAEKLRKPTRYGYARVSTKKQALGTSLEDQEKELQAAGAEEIYKDTFTGAVTDRPEFDRLLSSLRPGDELIVTKLDRIARSVEEGSTLIKKLLDQGITVRILNLGTLDNSATGKLTWHIMLAFAEFERDMIYDRTQGGRAYKRATDPDYKEGRKPKYTNARIDAALEYKKTHTYSETVKATGISKSTLIRAVKVRKVEENQNV